jgi:IclR family acetate operon transcriptional repressor
MTTTSADAPDRGPGVQALTRGLRMLEVISEQEEPVGVGELSRLVGLPKSTVQRLLQTLAQTGWVEPAPGPVTRWCLSPRMLAVGRRGSPHRDLRELSLPYIRALAERTQETIHLSLLEENGRIVLVDRVDSLQAIRTFNPIGTESSFHASSTGKAILAALSDPHVEEILSRPLVKMTPNTETDPKKLREQVQEIRQLGYAVNIQENRPHVCAIAAAVTDASGRPLGAVTVSIPDVRFDPKRVPEWGKSVVDASHAISDALRA